MTKQLMQSLKGFSVGLMIVGGGMGLATRIFRVPNPSYSFVSMVLIGTLGLCVHCILKSVLQRIDVLEQKKGD